MTRAMNRAMQGLMRPQIAALVAVLLINWLLFPNFFDLAWRDGRLFGSAVDVLNRGAPVALLAVGMTAVIATRGVDLSVGAVMAIAGAVGATLVTAGHGGWIAILGGLGAGLVCGLWNGMLVALLGMQPIVATLVLMVAGRGLAQLITEGTIVTFSDPVLIALGTGASLGLPTPVVAAFGVAAAATLLARRTALGLMIEAVGVNREAARLVGIPARLLIVGVYAFCGLCAGFAGLIVAGDIRGADANNAGLWLELDAILAVVLGGASLMGGRFSIPLSVVGAVIIQAMNTGILLSGLPPEFNLIVKAAIIILILILQAPAAAALLQRARPAPLRARVSEERP
jgi:ribose/xylose/arabinose/galactoside ABC-type transport system permease subunit